MGGYGSTRWGNTRTKYAVEDCLKLSIFFLRSYLRNRNMATLTWSRGGKTIAEISYMIIGPDEAPKKIRLIYTRTARGEKKREFDYPVELTPTPLPWGGERYWFICPNVTCRRRVGCLYLTPHGDYFACRHCNRLSYRSRQEGYQDLAFARHMAALMPELTPPGYTIRDLARVLKKW